MPSTRLSTWLLLLLSLAFFFVRAFRQAVEAPLANVWWVGTYAQTLSRGSAYSKAEPSPWLARLFTVSRYASPERLRTMADDALRRKDYEFVAFATLELPPQPDQDGILRLADQVATARHDLTWIYLPLCLRMTSEEGSPNLSEKEQEEIRLRLDKLQAYDPDNAAPHLVRARLVAAKPEWQREMEIVFTQPRLDSYTIRAFDLTRKVFLERGWHHPLVFVSTIEDYPPLDYSQAQHYARVLVEERGRAAEDAGRMDEALRDYLRVAQFGLRLKLQASTPWEELAGETIEGEGVRHLPSAFRKAKRDDEARLFEYLEKRELQVRTRPAAPLEVASNYDWSALMANFSAVLVALFLAISLISVVYANVTRQTESAERRSVFELLRAAQNYAPVFLFASCIALYLASIPFAQNFAHYMTTQERLTFVPPDLIARSYPLLFASPGGLAPANPFPDYAPWALAVLTLVTALGWVHRRKAPAIPGPVIGGAIGNVADEILYLLVALAGIGFVAASREVWEFALVGEVVLALLILSASWVTSIFAGRVKSEVSWSRPTWMAGIGSVLLLVLMAGLSGGLVGMLARVATGRARDLWPFLIALLPAPVAGILGASRIPLRKISLGAFTLLALLVALILYAS